MTDVRRPSVVLLGLGATTRSALDGLRVDYDIALLVRDVRDPTTEHAEQLGVRVLDDASPTAVRAAVREIQPDAVVVSSYNRILDADLIARCPFVNVHYAPLPRGRGRATVNWAIINGDSHAAISIHHLVAGLDAGGILYQKLVPITPTSTSATLYDELNALQGAHIADAVRAAIAGEEGLPQVDDEATWLCRRTPDDGEIDWSQPTGTIDRLIRALREPFPPAFTWLGLEQLHIVEASPVTDAPRYEGRIPGRVVRVDRSVGDVQVLTGDGMLRIRRVRLDAGHTVNAADVIRSTSTTLGLRVADLVRAMRSQQSPH